MGVAWPLACACALGVKVFIFLVDGLHVSTFPGGWQATGGELLKWYEAEIDAYEFYETRFIERVDAFCRRQDSRAAWCRRKARRKARR